MLGVLFLLVCSCYPFPLLKFASCWVCFETCVRGNFVPVVVFLHLSGCCSCRFCLCVIRSRFCLVHPAGYILGEITAWCAIILTILVFGIVKSLLSCGNWSAVQIIRVFTEQVGSSLGRRFGRLRPVTGLKLPTIPEVLV